MKRKIPPSQRHILLAPPKPGKFKCVMDRGDGRWVARTSLDGKHVHLGSFKTPELAARAADAWKVATYGAESVYLNFPEDWGK